MVYNTRPGAHPVFEDNRRRFEGHDFISFAEIQEEWKDPTNFEPNNLHNPGNTPGHEVRRQTFDYINLFTECIKGGPAPDKAESFLVIIEVRACVRACVRASERSGGLVSE